MRLEHRMCGALGPAYGNSSAVYQSALSSFWGSAAFLISSLIQWYEAINKVSHFLYLCLRSSIRLTMLIVIHRIRSKNFSMNQAN